MNYENMHTLKGKMAKLNAGKLLTLPLACEFLKFAMGSFQTWQSAVGIDIDRRIPWYSRQGIYRYSVILILGSALICVYRSLFRYSYNVEHLASYRVSGRII